MSDDRIRDYWDADAATYDDATGHAPRSPAQRAAGEEHWPNPRLHRLHAIEWTMASELPATTRAFVVAPRFAVQAMNPEHDQCRGGGGNKRWLSLVEPYVLNFSESRFDKNRGYAAS